MGKHHRAELTRGPAQKKPRGDGHFLSMQYTLGWEQAGQTGSPLQSGRSGANKQKQEAWLPQICAVCPVCSRGLRFGLGLGLWPLGLGLAIAWALAATCM